MNTSRTITQEMREKVDRFAKHAQDLRDRAWDYVLWEKNRQANVDRWNDYYKEEVISRDRRISYEELPFYTMHWKRHKDDKELFAEHKEYHVKAIRYTVRALIEIVNSMGVEDFSTLPRIVVPDAYGDVIDIAFIPDNRIRIVFTEEGDEVRMSVGGDCM